MHIHAQPRHHTEAYILGTRPGLLALRAAIDAALESGEGNAEVMVADGEGYEVIVLLEEADWTDSTWGNTAVPSTAEYAREKNEAAIWPWNRTPKRPRGGAA